MERNKTLILPSPAKLNLFLHVTGQRPDGYHTLQTAFQFIDLYDTLEFQLTPTEIRYQGPDLDCLDEHNLILKAASRLKETTGTSQGAQITLNKQIPIGGGLAGGSSNAATTLIALNYLWNCGLSASQLAELGLTLGADVPIFIFGHAAFAEGIGEKLTAISPPEPWYVLIHPNCSANTQEIFSHKALTRDTTRIKIVGFRLDEGKNDCESVAKVLYPPINDALVWLDQYTSAKMTGTGSCVFGQFQDHEQAQKIARQIPKPFTGYVVKGMNVSLLHQQLQQNNPFIGTSPSGKAPGFDLGIPRFESWRPNHLSAERFSATTPTNLHEAP